MLPTHEVITETRAIISKDRVTTNTFEKQINFSIPDAEMGRIASKRIYFLRFGSYHKYLLRR